MIFQGDIHGGSFGEDGPVGVDEGPGAASTAGPCPGDLSDLGSENGDETIVEFVKVKRKGKISVQALVNNVKFYCNRTVQDGQMKIFRCSYYDSEQCKCRFTATRVDSDTDAEWEVEDLGNATNHFHETAKIETKSVLTSPECGIDIAASIDRITLNLLKSNYLSGSSPSWTLPGCLL